MSLLSWVILIIAAVIVVLIGAHNFIVSRQSQYIAKQAEKQAKTPYDANQLHEMAGAERRFMNLKLVFLLVLVLAIAAAALHYLT